jgi:hypothetical protein
MWQRSAASERLRELLGMGRRAYCRGIGALLALIISGAGVALLSPTVRHAVSGLLNLPDRLPALSADSRVHYQPGAENFAREVAALLPSAIARIEAAQGRSFAHPVIVGVYTTQEAFAKANGLGSTDPRGVTFSGRVNLSPLLHVQERDRLPAILTHELSHAHIQGWIGSIAYLRLPNWFKEGLAVVVSGGGGAEAVGEEEARLAILRGERLIVAESGSLQALIGLRLERVPGGKAPWYPVVLAYREAEMFVSYLHDSDGPAFSRMIGAILDGRTFAEAIAASYHADLQSLWQTFALSCVDKS